MTLTMINNKVFIFFILLGLFSNTLTAQKKDKFVLVIDAGHGGKDSGTSGHYENEKYIALDVALEFGRLVEKKYKKEVNVIYTRKTDVFLELYERAAIANRNHADLFVSVHCNAARNREAQGTETFVMGLNRMDENIEVSKRENSVISLEDNKERYQSFNPNDPEAVILFETMHTTFQEQSIEFADLVEKAFVRNGRPSRGVKQNIFHVLRETAMPSVLIELGFLSNRTDAEYLNSNRGKEQSAESIFKAFEQYKKEFDKRNGVVSNKPKPKPKPKEKIRPGISYKIQFLTSKNQYSKSSSKLKGLVNVEIRKAGDLFKYYYGHTNDPTERDQMLQYVKRKGFTDAFVVEIKDKVPSTGMYYTVQVLTSNRKYRARSKQLRPLKNVERVKVGKMYKYFYGKANTNEEAEKLLKEVVDKGFNNAFIVEKEK